MIENIDIEVILPWILAAISILAALVITLSYTLKIFKIVSIVKRQSAEPLPDTLVPVSVILYSPGDSDSLSIILSQLREQDYQAPYEVIVVNDGRDYASESLLCSLASEWPQLRHTFTPEAMRNVSRKKLALTLGMKSASYDAVIHITSSTRIHSRDWLRRMASAFADESVDLVIGYACREWRDDRNAGTRLRAHDSLIESVQYLASAISGHAYRGDGDNLGYRRSIFFAEKGFSSSINLSYGDDDIFVNEIARRDNTKVMIAHGAQVMSESRNPVEAYIIKKYREKYIARYCGCSRRSLYDTVNVMMWTWLAAAVGAFVTALYSWEIISMVLLSTVLTWLPLTIAYSKVAKALNSRKFLLSVAPTLLFRPFYNLSYFLKSRRIHTARFEWQAIGDQQR